MTWNSIMGFISSLTLFLPIFLILAFRLGAYRSFPVLLVYFTMIFINNLMTEGYIRINADVAYCWGISVNLLDAPLMLLFLTYFSTSAKFTRRLIILILSFIVFELAVVLLVGFNVGAITIILGPGILIVFALCLFFVVRQSKITVMHKKAAGKTLISAALVFAYGCYCILYILYYVIKPPEGAEQKASQVADTFLIYFLVTTFSSLILCTGILFERKRIQKLIELIKARKELQTIYKDAKRAAPFRTAMLDFDNESWN
jgi:hypothetical protein